MFSEAWQTRHQGEDAKSLFSHWPDVFAVSELTSARGSKLYLCPVLLLLDLKPCVLDLLSADSGSQ